MRRRELLSLTGAAAVGLGLSFALGRGEPPGTDVGDLATAREVMTDASSPRSGPRGADLSVAVFTDYRCPACRRADPEMRRAVEADGTVTVVYKDWPIFGERSERAARVALASAVQGIYPAVHHAFMAAPDLDERALRAVIERTGGDWARLEADLRRSTAAINEQLAGNARQAFALGLGGTPGYLIGMRRVRGALDESGFRAAFDAARSRNGA